MHWQQSIHVYYIFNLVGKHIFIYTPNNVKPWCLDRLTGLGQLNRSTHRMIVVHVFMYVLVCKITDQLQAINNTQIY